MCVGLAVGTAITRAQVPLMGLLGLLAAPAALEASQALLKGTVEAPALSGRANGGGTSALVVAATKSVEYGCLGLAVGWFGNRAWGGAAAHVAAGLTVGTVFGGCITTLAYGLDPASFSTADLVSRGVNELLFPVGCALVLFSARAMAQRSATGKTGTPSPNG